MTLRAYAPLALILVALPATAVPIVVSGAGTRANAMAFDSEAGNLFASGSLNPAGPYNYEEFAQAFG